MRTLFKTGIEERESTDEIRDTQIELADQSDDNEEASEDGEDEGSAGTCSALVKMFCKPLACLLVFVPVAWGLHFAGKAVEIPPIANFVFNFLSIIPLAWVISESTESLEVIVGPMLGILLNSTFGNVVEILMSIAAISKGKVKIVQSQLLGAMIMNSLAVLGMCFFVAGLSNTTKKFNQYQAMYNIGLLSVSALALYVPTGLAVFDDWSKPKERLALSRMVAIFMVVMYAQWLVFNLCTHVSLFQTKKKEKKSREANATHISDLMGSDHTEELLPSEDSASDSDDEEGGGIHWCCACLMLFCATVLVAFHCDWLVESIDPVCEEFGVKTAFISFVLLPMVGNFSEVIAAVSIACKGKLDLAIGVAIGSATQIALMVLPIAVFIAWGFNQPLDLDIETFQAKILVLSILVAALLTIDGEANWLKGSLLVTTYLIIAASFWFMHDREFQCAGMPPEICMNKSLADLKNASAGGE